MKYGHGDAMPAAGLSLLATSSLVTGLRGTDLDFYLERYGGGKLSRSSLWI